MKTLRIIAGILITLCIINVITSCKDKEDEPIPEPIKKPLVDKKDSIFLIGYCRYCSPALVEFEISNRFIKNWFIIG